MSLCRFETIEITNWREKYLALQKKRELQMTKRVKVELSGLQKNVLRLPHRTFNRSFKKALGLRAGMSLGLLRQRLLFAKKIYLMLHSPGLGVPFFIGIGLTRKMKMLIRQIISHKNMMWMIQLKQQWLNNEIAKAERGEQVRAEFGWLKINLSFKKDIFKMKVVVQDGRDNTASQNNYYWRKKLDVMKQEVADGKYQTMNAWNSTNASG